MKEKIKKMPGRIRNYFCSHMSAQVTVTVVLLLILAGLVLQIYVKNQYFNYLLRNTRSMEESMIETSTINIDKETFEVSFDAEPVFVHANPQVRVDSAKVAVVKGPLVYCVEEADNGENLSSVMVNTDQKIEETYDDELLEGCSVLHITGKKISEKGWNEGILYQNRKVELEDVKLTLVPYCYWGNRENGEMLVWMKELFYM